MIYFPALVYKCYRCKKNLKCIENIENIENNSKITLECSCGKKYKFKVNNGIAENIDAFIQNESDYIFKKETIDTTIFYFRKFLGNITADLFMDTKELKFTFHDVEEIFDTNMINVEKSEECVVCYEQCKSTTKCNHYICIDCYEKISNNCPLCRQELTDKKSILSIKVGEKDRIYDIISRIRED